MTEVGSELFLEVPGVQPRVLCRGQVLAVDGAHVTVQFADLALEAEPEDEVATFAHRDGVFTRQTARLRGAEVVGDPRQSGWVTQAQLELIGLATPCDQRAGDRVSTRGLQLRADFEDEIDCEVLDVSATSLSLVAFGRHVPGSIAEVALHFEGKMLPGRGAIQSAQPASGQRVRYGIRVLDTETPLAAVLPRICAAARTHSPTRASNSV